MVGGFVGFVWDVVVYVGWLWLIDFVGDCVELLACLLVIDCW